MSERTELYLSGMRAVNNFFEMLYTAMLEAMPGALFSTTGCMWWRGYRIDAFKNLANAQYYCQIYTDTPNSLLFKESYKDIGRKPTNAKDIEYGVIQGSYFYPFHLELNLYKVHFFHLDIVEQDQLIRNFINYASEQATIWQESEFRTKTTNPKRLSGTKISRNPRADVKSYNRVSSDYLDAIPMQKELLDNFRNVLSEVSPELAGKKVEWLFPNSQWRNWDYRGWRLRFTEDGPNNRTVYRWNIYWQKPEKLICLLDDGSQKEQLGYFDLKHHEYFDLPTHEQTEVLEDFMQQMLSKKPIND